MSKLGTRYGNVKSMIVCEGMVRYIFGDKAVPRISFFGSLRSRRFDKADSGDALVLEYGGNVCDFDWQAISEHPGGLHKPSRSLDDFRNTYLSLIRNIRSCGVQPLLLSLPGLRAGRYIDYVSQNRDRFNILRWLGGDVSFINDWYNQYAQALRQLAEESDVPVIDIAGLIQQHPNPDEFYAADGIHLNDRGNALVTNVIRKFNF
ncbi:MAG: SGNH/GDSL hydrolase family protein [Bacteroidales bacterium]|nr:SGNH/GDSL hydrolase family protein [Bacteroidales bacterium]